MNRLHLLAQEIFPLALANLLLHLFLNLRAQLQDFELLGEFANQRLEPLADAGRFEQFLAQQRRKRRQSAGDEVGQAARVFNIESDRLQLIRQLWRVAHDIPKHFLRIAMQCLQLAVTLAQNVRLGHHAGAEEWTETDHLIHPEACDAFEEDDNISIRHLHRLVDLCHRADVVQVRSRRVLHTGIKLGHDSDVFLFGVERVHQRQRCFPAHR